jgi:hypothetical protein
VVEIRAGETQGATIAGKKDHGAPAEIFATVVAARLPVGNEDPQVTRGAIEGSAFGGHGLILIANWHDMISSRMWNLTASRRSP